MAIHHHIKRHTKRVVVGVLGALVVLVGIVMIPYPGPGWLVVFAGFAILATEFQFAHNVLEFLKHKYDGWVNWLAGQHIAIRILVLGFTGLVVLTTIYLLNTFGLINHFLNLHQDWLISPFFR